MHTVNCSWMKRKFIDQIWWQSPPYLFWVADSSSSVSSDVNLLSFGSCLLTYLPFEKVFKKYFLLVAIDVQDHSDIWWSEITDSRSGNGNKHFVVNRIYLSTCKCLTCQSFSLKQFSCHLQCQRPIYQYMKTKTGYPTSRWELSSCHISSIQ